MTAEITPEIQTELEKAYVIWFTSVRAAGMPQPTPVWGKLAALHLENVVP